MTAIALTITNVDSLADGGPLTFRAEDKGFEIGRDSHRDWTLPDQRLFISGCHCNIDFDGSGYVLTDVSRNGTFVNGARQRVKSPYRLQDGDTLEIGDYVIAVNIAAGGQREAFSNAWDAADAAPATEDDIWGASSSGPKPMDRREFKPQAKPRPAQADFVNSNLQIDAGRSFGDPFAPAPQAPPPAPMPSNPFTPPSTPVPMPSLSPLPPQFSSPQPQPPMAQAPRPPQMGGGGGDMLSPFKLGARLPSHSLSNRNQVEVAQEVGAMMLLVTEQLALLLKARASAKAMVKTRDRTVIGALDNNPLKFMADPGEALEAMLSKDRSGYLDGMRALREAFDDIRTHELATFSAMQKALSRLLSDLSPEVIEAKVQKGTFTNAKARAWETFVQRWDAKTEAHENGMLDVFLMYFSEAYQEATNKKRL
jgi:type VI secretion system protein ImpI